MIELLGFALAAWILFVCVAALVALAAAVFGRWPR